MNTKSKLSENLNSVFDITPSVVVENVAPVVLASTTSTSMMASDTTAEEPVDTGPIKEVEQNIRGLITTGVDALDHALDVAKQLESPRAFEVVGILIRQLSDMNMQLIDAHERKMKLLKSNSPAAGVPPPGGVINNNSLIFNGTTSEFNRMLESFKNKTNAISSEQPSVDETK